MCVCVGGGLENENQSITKQVTIVEEKHVKS